MLDDILPLGTTHTTLILCFKVRVNQPLIFIIKKFALCLKHFPHENCGYTRGQYSEDQKVTII